MTRLFILPAIFAISSLSLWYMICSAPGWESEGQFSAFELPKQFDNFTALADRFRHYKDEHFTYITTVFICTYLYKQTFAIPGSFFLNVIAGAVYDFWCGFILCCVLTTGGSTLCYLFSEQFGREYVMYYFGQKLTYLQQKIDDNSNRLMPFLLFARIFPISPSWLLNIVAPFLNIPLRIFVISAFVGQFFHHFRAGQRCAIYSLNNSDVNMLCIILGKSSLICSRRFSLISVLHYRNLSHFASCCLQYFYYGVTDYTIMLKIRLAPYNFICVQAGYILSELRSWDDIFSTSTMMKLFSIALLPLAYAIYVRPGAQKHQLIASVPEPEPHKMEIV
ncbi:SNARE-like domain protein [Necator americanus]|uniref:SNARE-like domain protein n=1 Tax=Necator americanus TaxID=51031 RepID=W2TXU4_NECAM|nr:SNARE-like domain protein [Necator americanus]ETN86499.1 SNARE-like domain protein [Necator americanus]